MSDTPRTDDILVEGRTQDDIYRLLTHARVLERELSASQAKIRELEGQLEYANNSVQIWMQRHSDQTDAAVKQAERAESAEQRLEKVEKALRELLECPQPGRVQDPLERTKANKIHQDVCHRAREALS